MDKKKVKEVKALALRAIDGKFLEKCENPICLARMISKSFDLEGCAQYSQREIARFNQNLDARGCLGRIAQIGAAIERYFPGTRIEFGEVMEDFFRNVLLEKLKNKPNQPDSFFEELLMYEDPHNILVVDGKQFEPLSVVFREDVEHPKIITFDFWEAIAASRLVSAGWLESNRFEKMRMLLEAEDICNGLMVTRENISATLLVFGKEGRAIELAWEILAVRPTARGLYFLYSLTGDERLFLRMKSDYSSRIIELLGKEVMRNVGRAV